MSEYYLDYTGSQLDDAINKVRSGYVLPSGDSPVITANGTHNVKNYENAVVNVPVPSNYVDTSGATADSYDIYNGKTAWANGKKVAGLYKATPVNEKQYNSASTDCSSSQLVIPCNFEPNFACVILNSGTYDTNTIISAMFWSDASTFHSKTSSGVIRTQESTGSYCVYDSTNKKVTIKKPSNYTWSSRNYRVFLFK